jgi:hypothetical protein
MTLPAYREANEADALVFARAEIAYFRDHKVSFGSVDLHWFDKSDNRKMAREWVKRYAMGHPTHMMYVVDLANAGWGLADEALRELIIELLDRGEQLPTSLAAYNMTIARGPVRRLGGPKVTDNFLRDIVIVSTVQQVMRKFGLKETRSRSRRRASACSIVSQALQDERVALGEADVVAIWRRYRPMI